MGTSYCLRHCRTLESIITKDTKRIEYSSVYYRTSIKCIYFQALRILRLDAGYMLAIEDDQHIDSHQLLWLHHIFTNNTWVPAVELKCEILLLCDSQRSCWSFIPTELHEVPISESSSHYISISPSLMLFFHSSGSLSWDSDALFVLVFFLFRFRTPVELPLKMKFTDSSSSMRSSLIGECFPFLLS